MQPGYIIILNKDLDLATSYERWQMERYGNMLVDRSVVDSGSNHVDASTPTDDQLANDVNWMYE